MNSKMALLMIVPLALWAIWTLSSTSDAEKEAATRSWNAEVNEHGQLTVLGVTIGKNSLKEAEKILKSHSEQALFLSPEESGKKPVIEAFFSKTPDGSKLILSLMASDELIEKIISNASAPMAFPSGNIKFKIASEHLKQIEGLTVSGLTSIPRIKITPDMLLNQFGAPEKTVPNGDIMHHLYPEIGLDAILDRSGEVMLQFVSPANFQEALELSGVLPKTKLTTPPTIEPAI